MPKCVDCRHGALRDQHNQQRHETLRKMAGHGLVCCGRSFCRATFTVWDAEHACDLFEPTDAPTVKARAIFFGATP
jgi:hypothetical protein